MSSGDNEAGAPDAAGQPAGEKEECGWCKWMKAGGCKAEFEVRTGTRGEAGP